MLPPFPNTHLEPQLTAGRMLSVPGLSFFVKTFSCIWCWKNALKLHDTTEMLRQPRRHLRIDEPYSFGHLSGRSFSRLKLGQHTGSEIQTYSQRDDRDIPRWCFRSGSWPGPGGGLGIWDHPYVVISWIFAALDLVTWELTFLKGSSSRQHPNFPEWFSHLVVTCRHSCSGETLGWHWF